MLGKLCIYYIFQLLLLKEAISYPPEDPIKCQVRNTNCTLNNAYREFPDRKKCHAAAVVYPKTQEEVISIVANATMSKTKMKAATQTSHSIPKLACPGGSHGLIISTKYLTRLIRFDVVKRLATVEAGVTLRSLITEASRVGLALPHSPYWWGITIGGLISTGSHGSTLWGKGSAVHDYVVGMTVVTPGPPESGYVVTRVLDEHHPDLAAAKVSLGVLGVITQVTLSLEPLFKRSITYKPSSDEDLADQVINFGKVYEFGDIQWYPSERKVIYRHDNRVHLHTPGNGVYDIYPFRPVSGVTISLNRKTEEELESKRHEIGKCVASAAVTAFLKAKAYGLTNNGAKFTGYPVVGFQHRLQASGTCQDSERKEWGCGWDPRLHGEFFHQTAFSIGLSKVKSFIKDVQILVRLNPRAFCMVDLYNGILMRYVTKSTAYLGKQEDSVDFDFTYYRSHDPRAPRLHEDVLEEIEQMAIYKYSALPHWAKNRNVAYHRAMLKYSKRDQFFEVKNRFDPMGLFANEWTEELFGERNWGTTKDGCALEGLCRCSEDSHCSPGKGYFCRKGQRYTYARVCSYIPLNDSVKPHPILPLQTF